MNPNVQVNVRGLTCSPDCAKCPKAKNGKALKAVRAYGGTGGLCIVGESPGANELLQGYPMIGPAGDVLNKAFKLAGVDRGYVWITNALLCQRPFNDEDLVVALDACRPRLQADLERARPTAICAVGGFAMRALQLPVTFVSQARGTVQYSPLLPGVPVIGTIHPAALLRGGAGEMAGGGKQKMNVDAQAMFLFADIAKAYKVSTGEIPAAWSDDILVVHEASQVKAAMAGILADIYEWSMLGLDLEWVCEGSKNPLDALGASAHRAIITWVGVGCAKRAVSFKWEALAEDYGKHGDDSGLMQLQAAMEDPELMKLAHNKQADKAVWEAQVGPIYGRTMDCYIDSETEFLTRAGWKRYDAVKRSDLLATIDEDGGLEWQNYAARTARAFSGTALQFEGQYTRAVVTPNHRMWCQPMRRTARSWAGAPLGPWALREAAGLLEAKTDTFRVLQACSPAQVVGNPGAAHPFKEWADAGLPWLELIGIWLTDGSLSFSSRGPTTISFHQAINGRAIALLEKLERAFGLTSSVCEHVEKWRSHPCVEKVWRLCSSEWARTFHATFGRYSKDRHLADFVWDLTRAERVRLLEAMFLGDGCQVKRTFVYNTFSKRLAGDVQAVCLSIGWLATVNYSGGGYHVQIRRDGKHICQIRARIHAGPNGIHNNGNVLKRHLKAERQVCFSVPNQRLVTRSGGRPAFHGNSMLMHHAAFPGIDHDLQQVVSQFLCVPPWKVDHARQIAEYKAQEKAEAKAVKAAEKEVKKAVRMSEHEAKNAKAAAEKLARKAERQAAHEARNAQLHADKEARKAKGKKPKGSAPAVPSRQLELPRMTSDTGPSMADEVVADILDPELFDAEMEDGY